MYAGILAAAVRVLETDGALGFTTTRVAEEAGISVGSLYQYFPNKQAMVVALHREAVEKGWEHVQRILDDPGRSARQKVEDVASWFISAEAAEISRIRPIGDEMEVFVSHDLHDGFETEVHRRFSDFVARESQQPEEAGFAANLLMTTIEAVGKAIASRPMTKTERRRWAYSTAEMLCDYLRL